MPTTKGTETEHTPGCRTDNAMKSNFEKICKWFDEQTELFTVSELHAKICSFAEKNTYQNSIFFTVEPSCSNIVCFTDRIWQVPFYQNNGTKIGKRTQVMKN